MTGLSPELRWAIVAILLAAAAAVSQLARRRLPLLAAALLLTPLPAFFFVRLTLADSGENNALGVLLSALASYLPPALGVLAAYLVEKAAAEGDERASQPPRDLS